MAAAPNGGYDCKFVSGLPGALQCLICTLVARDAQQLDCCGKIFCKCCLDGLKKSGNSSCPNCRNRKWKSFPDKKSDRDIKSLQVKCPNLDDSDCPWVGELRELSAHVTKCSSELCPCRYSSAGCTVKKFKKDLPAHEVECTLEHLSLSMDRIAVLEVEVKELRDLVAKSSSNVENINLPPVTFRFPDFKTQSRLMARDRISWDSQPFYSHHSGYKFCLRLQFHTDPVFSVSVVVCLMKGDEDDSLVWPFRGVIKFEILNQEINEDHLSGSARFMEIKESSRNCRVTGNADKNEVGWGAIRILTVGHPTYEEYVTNGSLYVRVNKVEVSGLNKFWLLDDLAC